MRRLALLTIAAAGLALAACGEPDRGYADDDEAMADTAPIDTAPAPIDETPDETGAEAPADFEPYQAPLPEDRRNSEETVQPESETLFY